MAPNSAIRVTKILRRIAHKGTGWDMTLVEGGWMADRPKRSPRKEYRTKFLLDLLRVKRPWMGIMKRGSAKYVRTEILPGVYDTEMVKTEEDRVLLPKRMRIGKERFKPEIGDLVRLCEPGCGYMDHGWHRLIGRENGRWILKRTHSSCKQSEMNWKISLRYRLYIPGHV